MGCFPTPEIPDPSLPSPLSVSPPVPRIPSPDLGLCCRFPIPIPQLPPVTIPLESALLDGIVAGLRNGRATVIAYLRSLPPKCPRN